MSRGTARPGRMDRVHELGLCGETIRLGQALKLSGIAGSGGEAARLIGAGAVTVNGAIETRRGRQLRRGDLVAVGQELVRVA